MFISHRRALILNPVGPLESAALHKTAWGPKPVMSLPLLSVSIALEMFVGMHHSAKCSQLLKISPQSR